VIEFHVGAVTGDLMISISTAAYLFWYIGTILIVRSWFDLVSVQLGWFGFAIAIGGSILSRLVTAPETSDSEALGDLEQMPDD
jgi:hypothetical protein